MDWHDKFAVKTTSERKIADVTDSWFRNRLTRSSGWDGPGRRRAGTDRSAGGHLLWQQARGGLDNPVGDELLLTGPRSDQRQGVVAAGASRVKT